MATQPRVKDRPYNPHRVTIVKNGDDWEVTLPEEFAADPADALVGWDPDWSVYAGDYDAADPFHLSQCFTFEEACEFLRIAPTKVPMSDPRKSPIRHRHH